MDLREVCIILPCFNESLSLPAMIGQIRDISNDINILVVDNSSTDNSYSVASNLGVNIVRESKIGKGYAVRRGFLSLDANCKIVVVVDGDDTYSLARLMQAVELVNDYKYDMVVGRRIMLNPHISGRGDPFRFGHGFGNLLLSKVSHLLYSSEVLDSLSGFRVMSRNFVESFSDGASGFELETELNAHAFFIKAAVSNIDVEYKGRLAGTTSKLKTYRDGFKILRANLRSFWTYRPRVACSIAALFWLLIALFLGYPIVTDYFETGLVPKFPRLIVSTGALVISIQLWVVGTILERINITHLNQTRKTYQNWRNKER